jgi:hypothetical protein
VEILILITIAAVVLWFVLRSRADKEQHRLDVREIEIDESEDVYKDVYTINFENMTVQRVTDVLDSPGSRHVERYALRERDGRWQWKASQETWQAEVEHCRTTIDPRGKDRLAKIEGGPKWERIPDERAARINTAYKRYVQQG